MRVLFVGDMSGTGFGTVTMDLGSEMLKRGLDLRFVSLNELGTLPEPYYSRTLAMTSVINVVNSMTGESGVESASPLASLFQSVNDFRLTNDEPWGDWIPEALILLGDIESVRFHVADNPDYLKVPIRWHYCPVEGRGLSPLLADDLWAQVPPVAMSKFGADVIEEAIGRRPPVIYHGVDTHHFYKAKPSQPIRLAPLTSKPFQVRNRDEAKTMWGHYFATRLPARAGSTAERILHTDKWMLRTDRHMPRKLYNSMLRGLVPVLADNPDALVILHCNSKDQGGYLPDTIRKLPGVHQITGDLEPGKPDGYGLFERSYSQIVVTNLGGRLPREALCSLYNAADLYVSTSAEGFGLTIAESLACGVPAVGLDYSAVPEVIGPAGVTVPRAYEFDNQYDHFWAAIDEQRFAEAVHALLNDANKREALGRKGPRHVRASFSWDVAASQFADLLQASALEEAA